MNGQKISETEALDIIARVFDRNMRRMNYVRGELFIFWGALLSLTALAEYGLYHWTGDVRVLWSLAGTAGLRLYLDGSQFAAEGPRPHGVRRPADPDMGHAGDDLGRRDRLCRNHPREYDKPRRRHAAAARHGTGYHRRILPGERLPAIGVVRSAADALDLRGSSWLSTIRSVCRSTPKAGRGCSNSPPMAYCSYCYPVLSSAT